MDPKRIRFLAHQGSTTIDEPRAHPKQVLKVLILSSLE
jgi:hypothetical protein